MTIFGANCYDVFLYHQRTPTNTDRSPYVRLKEIADAGLKFVRFAASPFWPAEWRAGYLADKAQYLGALDDVMSAAQALGLQVIPTLFWNALGVADLNGEHLKAYSDTSSKTMSFVHTYIRDVLGRYANSPHVLCWEFANEWNINLDLPVDRTWGIDTMSSPDQGTPSFAQRTNDDVWTTPQYQQLTAQFQAWVRQMIPAAQISMGNAWSHWAATQLFTGKLEADTPAQHVQAVQVQNPVNGNFTSVHLYIDQMSVYSKTVTDYAAILKLAADAAARSGNKLLVGEFGLAFTGNKAADQAAFDQMIAAIKNSGAHYAAVWNYDSPDGAQMAWDIVNNNANAWVLQKLAAATA